MTRAFGLFAFAILGFVSAASPVQAAAAVEPLQVTMTVSKVSADETKKELLISAEEAKSGDILVYRATYHNSGNSSLREIVATIPIPPSLVYLSGSAVPNAERASKEGRSYFPIASLPKHTPTTAWRTLRWGPRDLAPGAEFTVELRAQVSGASVAQ